MGAENWFVIQGRRSRRSPLRAAGFLKPAPTLATQWCLSIPDLRPRRVNNLLHTAHNQEVEEFNKMWENNFSSIKEVYTALPIVLKTQFIHEWQDHYKHTPSRLFFDKTRENVIIAIAKATPVKERKQIVDVLSGMDRVGLITKRRQLV